MYVSLRAHMEVTGIFQFFFSSFQMSEQEASEAVITLPATPH